jgi:hypothetical protein
MRTPSFPEDSVLRRHVESAAAMKRQAWLDIPPTDAVLRRHYAQIHQPAAVAISPPKLESRPAPSATQKTPDPTALPSQVPRQPQPTGFFGWLGKLFGG